MALSDITQREHVLEAIAEFDRLGRERFLAKYGFRPSRSYWLIHEGAHYDSKAIMGAAHGYAYPSAGPLSAAEFSGGDATVKRKLEELGFVVKVDDSQNREDSGRDIAAPGFLLTWKESGWPHENIVRMRREFSKQGYVDERWRLLAFRRAQIGTPVWILKQGPGTKGIFGAGKITGSPALGDAGNGKRQMMAPIRFTRFEDPKHRLLIGETDVRRILSHSQMRAQASGYPLSAEQVLALLQIMPIDGTAAATLSAEDADPETFDPTNIADARKRILRTITQRRGQREFRDALLSAYEGRCAITGCNIRDVLEAAHIHPYRGPDTNKVTNGLLLRADLHTLFDCLLLTIEPETLTIVVAPQLRDSEYGRLHGKSIRSPKIATAAPSKQALKWHREASGL